MKIYVFVVGVFFNVLCHLNGKVVHHEKKSILKREAKLTQQKSSNSTKAFLKTASRNGQAKHNVNNTMAESYKRENLNELVTRMMDEEFEDLENHANNAKMTDAVSGSETTTNSLNNAGKLNGHISKISDAFKNMKARATKMDEDFREKFSTIKEATRVEMNAKIDTIEANFQALNTKIERYNREVGAQTDAAKEAIATKWKKRYGERSFKEVAAKKGKKGLERAAAVSTGLKSFVDGVRNGQWMDIVTGALTMVAAVSALFGPVGTMISIALTCLSTLITIFGGIFGPKQESTEDIIKRVLDEALIKERANELRAEGVGLRKLYGEVSRSIGNFRKERKIEPAQAMKLYNLVFKGVPFFGYLDSYISEDCNIGDALAYDDDDNKKEQLKKKSNRCLEFLNLYCDLSIARQMLMTDLVSFLEELSTEDETGEASPTGEAAEETTERTTRQAATEENTDEASALGEAERTPLTEEEKAALKATRNNIAKLISYEQRADMRYLLFLYNPIDYPENRYIAAKYMSAPERYPTIGKYMIKLDEVYALGMEEGSEGNIEAPELITAQKMEEITQIVPRLVPSLFREHVIYCTETRMMGSCFEFARVGDYKSEYMKGWNGAIKSVYLSANRKWTGYMGSNLDETQIGPYYGPGFFSLPDDNRRVFSAKIEETDKLSSEMLKVCKNDDMDMAGECMLFPPKTYNTLDLRGTDETSQWAKSDKENKRYACKLPYRENKGGELIHTCKDWTEDDASTAWCPIGQYEDTLVRYGGDKWWHYCYLTNNWDKEIKSFSLPKGLRLYPDTTKHLGLYEFQENNKEELNRNIEYYYGPLTNTLASKNWRSMRLEKVEDGASCTDMVKICQGENMGGHCTCLKPPSEKDGVITYSNTLHSLQLIDYTKDESKIKSMKIPGGVRVGVFTDSNDQGMPFGPYDGPITVSKVDGSDAVIKTLKMTRMY